MATASNIHSLLERVLPLAVSPAPARFGRRQRLFNGVGLPSQDHAMALVERLELTDPPHALYAELRQRALRGEPAALNDLGWIWLNGRYWRADPLLAGHLLRMAAQQGSATAWYNLGQQYYFGKGVDISYASAAGYYRQAFERGMGHAAAALGDLYEEEVCDGEQEWNVDSQLAYQWFLRGAEQGEARCRFEVGYRLLHGLHIEADACGALHWLELASAAGVVQAAEELALHFRQHNAARARHWREQALELGSGHFGRTRNDDQLSS